MLVRRYVTDLGMSRAYIPTFRTSVRTELPM